MITGLKQKLDYSDYARIPPDGKRYELLEGDVYVTPAPSPLHQRVYALVVQAEGDAPLSHPDWPGLTISLAELWR